VKVTYRMVELALYRLLMVQGVSVGFSLPLCELLALWPKTTLRRGDLTAVIERLRGSGHLSIDHTPEGPLVRLLDESFGMVNTREDRLASQALGALRDSRKPTGGHLQFLLPPATVGRRTGDKSSGDKGGTST
jgi:hypothetical protein